MSGPTEHPIETRVARPLIRSTGLFGSGALMVLNPGSIMVVQVRGGKLSERLAQPQ